MVSVEGNGRSRAHAEATFSGSPETALARARDAALRIPGAHPRSSTAEAVEVAVGMTLKSWGEVVRVTAHAREKGTALRIQSRSKVSITWADWGKNRRNVETVLEGLTGSAEN